MKTLRACLLVGAMLAASGQGARATEAGPVVSTQYGQVQGFVAGGIANFEGIPYAAPPVGALRWKAPQPPANFTGVFQATSFGSQCAQPLSQFGHPGTSEDCLYLNIQAPASATASSKLPVMVWIHGGAFITGEGWDYDGTALIQSGSAIIVTLNYRLGLLGFMANPALAAENMQGETGNYGLLDQQAAIAWVKRNIAAFGGNPNNVTIFGESAGGQSVIDNLASATTPKIQRAIIESGAYEPALPTLAAAEADSETRMAALGCPTPQTAACLRSLSVTRLLGAVNPVTDLGKISPIVDGHVLPVQPLQAFNSGAFQRVPVINGSNHDEWRLFVILDQVLGAPPLTLAAYTAEINAQYGAAALQAYPASNYPTPDYADAALVTDSGFACGAHLVSSLLAQYVPVYSYELNDPNAPDLFLPFDPAVPNAGDAHASELPYLWPALQSALFGKGPAQFNPAQQRLAASMRHFWTSFATYGRPLAPATGLWVPYATATDAVQSFISPSPQQSTDFVSEHQCDFWKSTLLEEAGLPGSVPY